MTLWKMLATTWLIGAVAVAGRAQDVKFSHTLSTGEWTDAGMAKLSTDQLAVLDALVRRDQRINAVPDPAHPSPVRFTQRLLSDERLRAGLGSLSDAELTRLDTLVANFESGPSSVPNATGPEWTPILHRPGPEIHGMLSFTYGAGSGGYEEMGGAMVVSVDDPAHNLSVLFGYATMRTKGPFLGGGCYPAALLRRPR